MEFKTESTVKTDSKVRTARRYNTRSAIGGGKRRKEKYPLEILGEKDYLGILDNLDTYSVKDLKIIVKRFRIKTKARMKLPLKKAIRNFINNH